MSSKPIPPGYLLHLTTWENDGDVRMTQSLSGLTAADVHFLLTLATAFHSRHGIPTRGLGNGSVPTSTLQSLVHQALAAHPAISPSLRTRWTDYSADEADDLYTLFTDDLLGYPAADTYINDGNFCRVFDSYEVFWVPAPLENVSPQFPAPL